jgi:Tol biopolymer transport system component
MGLEPGSRLGHYEILGSLGTGGMSEVYRARDLSLGREVAIKMLPTELSADPSRLARFEREAQLLAALSHPNVAVIHGIEREGSLSFLVLELIPGKTLAERIAEGPLPFPEARSVFLQIAQALEAAHGKGIIHRDLKPGNVKLTADGTVKLLDFGLGKDIGIRPTKQEKTATYTGHRTSVGMVMGTPGYMSPEQARGQDVSGASDIWSFGVCLFEALSGKNPFQRGTLPDTLAAILNEEPHWGLLPPGLPARVHTLLRRCLQKRSRDRLHDIADVRIELEDTTLDLPSLPARTVEVRWLVGLAIALGAALVWILAGRGARNVEPPVVRRFVLELPPTAPMSLSGGRALASSPNGARLVYTARRSDRTELYLRNFDGRQTVPIPGTDGASGPFFSPRGDQVGFFADGKLKVLSLPGGSPVSLSDGVNPRGAVWIDRGDGTEVILFSPSSSGGLSYVLARGGAPIPLTVVDTASGERDHRWPSMLPDGKAALFTVWKKDGFDVRVLELASGATEKLVDDASYPRYVPTGHLVFAREEGLYAASFDLGSRRVVSEPVLVVEDVLYDDRTGAAHFDFTADGTLLYAPAENGSTPSQRASVFIVDSSGSATPIGEPRESIQVPRLSPDGRLLLVTVLEADATDLWLLNLARGGLTRLTFDGESGAGVFSPDGRRIAYSSAQQGRFAIFEKAADGTGEPTRLTEGDHPQFPTSWSPDSNVLLYAELDPDSQLDIWTLRLSDGQKSPLIRTSFEEASAVFSPDGTLIAYTSTESGQEEVYVRSFPETSGRWPISTQSGSEPVWSRNGRRLYFRSNDSLMAVDITREPTFAAGRPRVLFDAPFDLAGVLYANYDVGLEGDSFVMIRTDVESTTARLNAVVNWFEELERRVPARP